jgi:endonuclease YncB( thermonuclease family)
MGIPGRLLVIAALAVGLLSGRFHPSLEAFAQECCVVCSKGQACGDACISKKKQCHKPPGCACNPDSSDLWRMPDILPAASLQQSSMAPKAAAVDGDTIRIGEEVIRLEGIDAPEMKQVCRNSAGKDYRCGREAKAALEKLLSSNMDCKESARDRYGRLLAYCTANGIDINRELVRQGWAFAFMKYSARYAADEAEARKAKRGIWAGTAEAPWDWRAAQIAGSAPKGECVIKGNISGGKKIYFMPFHTLYKNVKVDEGKGERWFCTEDEALAAGWRRALR